MPVHRLGMIEDETIMLRLSHPLFHVFLQQMPNILFSAMFVTAEAVQPLEDVYTLQVRKHKFYNRNKA